MQKHQSTCITETAHEAWPFHQPSPVLQLAQARTRHKIRVPLASVPGGRFCQAKHASLAIAEFALWQASGGDFLRTVRKIRVLEPAVVFRG